MDAPKRLWVDLLTVDFDSNPYDKPAENGPRKCEAEYILVSEHVRIVAEKDAEIERLREAAMPADVLDEVERAHGGHVWSAVRSGLSRHRERLVQAFDSGSYEMEAARLDAVAREITADIEPMIEKYAALAHRRAARWEGK